MITVTKTDSAVQFEFDGSQHYLYDGTMEVPFNSLILVEDESDMITFRKASTNDILFSAMYTEFSSLGNTKDDVVSALEDMMFAEGGGGGGVDPEDVVEIVESALTDYWTSAQTQSAINAATSGTPSSQVIEQLRTDVNTISGDVTNKYDKVSGITIELNEEDNPFINIEKELEDGSTNYTDINDAGLNSAFENNEDGGVYNSYIGQGSLGNSATDSPDENVTSERNLNISTDGFEQTIYENYDDGETQYLRYSSENTFNYSNGLTLSQQWYDPENDETTTSTIEIYNNQGGDGVFINLNDGSKALDLNTTNFDWTDGRDSRQINWGDIATLNDIPEYSAGTGIEIRNNVISATGGSSNFVELTQAQYDALVSGGTVDPDALYIISDAEEVNLSGYALSSAVTQEISAAVSGKADSSAVTQEISAAVSGKADSSAVTQSLTTKQDTLVSGQNIKTINSQSLLGSGNITISGGGGSYQYYTEDTTGNTATIHIENTDNGTTGEVYVDGSSVDMYASRTEEDEDNGSMVETHSDINGNNAGIAMYYEKIVDDELTAHSYLNVEEDNISFEVSSDEVHTTTLAVTDSGVTINGDNVVTEAAFEYDPITSALTITFLNA